MFQQLGILDHLLQAKSQVGSLVYWKYWIFLLRKYLKSVVTLILAEVEVADQLDLNFLFFPFQRLGQRSMRSHIYSANH